MVDVSKLPGVWFHSYEEDEGDRKVYRNASYDLPRSRAPRESLELLEDGTVAFGGPGPADQTVSSPGSWDLSGNVLTLSTPATREEWEIEALDDDRLILRPGDDREESDGESEEYA